ncbi:MAG: redoxin domain-containing protein [Candidatus Eisenbacteria bacterium]|nr:redoxin domain-containing protein [Candidatus Eisenbacteria bacterium]
MRDRPVDIVSIDGGRRTRAAEEFLDEHGATHTVLGDPENTVFEAYEVRGIPTTVVIDQSGRLMYKHVGFRPGDEEIFAKEIETLLEWGGEA